MGQPNLRLEAYEFTSTVGSWQPFSALNIKVGQAGTSDL